MTNLQDWNIVVSVHEHCYQRGRLVLEEFGDVRATGFFNVLPVKVDSRETFLQQLQEKYAADPSLQNCLSHVIPAFSTFLFQSPEEFESWGLIDPVTASKGGDTYDPAIT